SFIASRRKPGRWRRGPLMQRILTETFQSGNHRRVRMPDWWNDFVRRPAAAERLVESHEAVACKPDDLGTLLLQSELLPFGVENVEEIGQAPVVALGGHLRRLARRIDGGVQAAQALSVATIGDVGFVDLLHGHKNGLLVRRGKLMRP